MFLLRLVPWDQIIDSCKMLLAVGPTMLCPWENKSQVCQVCQVWHQQVTVYEILPTRAEQLY